MIEVELYRKGDRHLLTVMGHAGYASYGKDIVCAGVSSLCMALVCHLKLLEERGELLFLDYRMGSGYFTCRICQRPFNDLSANALDLVCRGFQLIERGYPACLKFSSRQLL